MYLLTGGTSVLSFSNSQPAIGVFLPLDLKGSMKTIGFGKHQRGKARRLFVNYVVVGQHSGEWSVNGNHVSHDIILCSCTSVL